MGFANDSSNKQEMEEPTLLQQCCGGSSVVYSDTIMTLFVTWL